MKHVYRMVANKVIHCDTNTSLGTLKPPPLPPISASNESSKISSWSARFALFAAAATTATLVLLCERPIQHPLGNLDHLKRHHRRQHQRHYLPHPTPVTALLLAAGQGLRNLRSHRRRRWNRTTLASPGRPTTRVGNTPRQSRRRGMMTAAAQPACKKPPRVALACCHWNGCGDRCATGLGREHTRPGSGWLEGSRSAQASAS